MFKACLSSFILLSLLLLSGCGVYLVHPQPGNNAQWKVVKYNDTLIYHLNNRKFPIDSVVNASNKQVYYGVDSFDFRWPASQLNPGINDVRLLFYSGGKKRQSAERLYMVSDVEPKQISIDDYELLSHDEAAFTQGLLWHNHQLYESTGLVGESTLRILNPQNGDLVNKQFLNEKIFAEGISFYGDKLVLLTWKDGLVYEFDGKLIEKSMHPYKQEGWGLTFDGKHLIASNGSNELFYLSNTYKIDSSFQVFNHRGAVSYLNELEYIEGKIWANVLGSDQVVVINPQTGKVELEIDAAACLDRYQYPNAGVLNGIAYNPNDKIVYLTGKNWPFIIVWRPSFFDNSNN